MGYVRDEVSNNKAMNYALQGCLHETGCIIMPPMYNGVCRAIHSMRGVWLHEAAANVRKGRIKRGMDLQQVTRP